MRFVRKRRDTPLTSDGEYIQHGTAPEDNVNQVLPFPKIGSKLAERAGVTIVDAGMARRSIERRILGLIGLKRARNTAPLFRKGKSRSCKAAISAQRCT